MNKLWLRLVIFLGLLIFIIGIGWFWWHDAISPANSSNKNSQNFIIQSGESARSIATRLKNVGLIRDQIGFFLLVKFNKSDNNLQAGDFRLNPSMTATEILNELSHGTLDSWVTTLEGWRIEEVALQLAKQISIPESEFLKNAREGYMFPDTYLIGKDATAGAVIETFLHNFQTRVTPDIINAFKKNNLTQDEGIILASIVEREGRSDTDRPIIAGILLKRLQNDWPLQADATLQYALGYQAGDKSWWKKSLTDFDKKVQSPYNTYLHIGLPPAPICNPGLSSIKAVANPIPSDYWYYIHDNNGVAHYATTIEQHEANVAKYL
jgi:UPF0755 protein